MSEGVLLEGGRVVLRVTPVWVKGDFDFAFGGVGEQAGAGHAFANGQAQADLASGTGASSL